LLLLIGMADQENQEKRPNPEDSEKLSIVESPLRRPPLEVKNLLELLQIKRSAAKDKQLSRLGMDDTDFYDQHPTSFARRLFLDQCRYEIDIAGGTKAYAFDNVIAYLNWHLKHEPHRLKEALETEIASLLPVDKTFIKPEDFESYSEEALAEILALTLNGISRDDDNLVILQSSTGQPLLRTGDEALKTAIARLAELNPQRANTLYQQAKEVFFPVKEKASPFRDHDLVHRFVKAMAPVIGPQIIAETLSAVDTFTSEDSLDQRVREYQFNLVLCVDADIIKGEQNSDALPQKCLTLIDELIHRYRDKPFSETYQQQKDILERIQMIIPAAVMSLPEEEQLPFINNLRDTLRKARSFEYEIVHIERTLRRYGWWFLIRGSEELFKQFPPTELRQPNETGLISDYDIWDNQTNFFSALDAYILLKKNGNSTVKIDQIRTIVLTNMHATNNLYGSRTTVFSNRFPELAHQLIFDDIDPELGVELLLIAAKNTSHQHNLQPLINAVAVRHDDLAKGFLERLPSVLGTYTTIKIPQIGEAPVTHEKSSTEIANELQKIIEKVKAANDVVELEETLRSLVPLAQAIKEPEMYALFSDSLSNMLSTLADPNYAFLLPEEEQRGHSSWRGDKKVQPYRVSKIVTEVLSSFPPDARFSALEKVLLVYDKSLLKIRDGSNLMEFETLFQDLEVQDQIAYIKYFNDFIFNLRHHSDPFFYSRWAFTHDMDKALHNLVQSHPQEALTLINELLAKTRFAEGLETSLIKEKRLALVATIQENELTNAYQTAVEHEVNQDSQLPQQPSLEGLYAFLVACVKPELKVETLARAHKLIADLIALHERADFPENKKIGNIYEFLTTNQERIGKILMFFPQTEHASQFVRENASQHGFTRLEERLALADAFSIEDIFKTQEALTYLDSGQVTQGFVYNLLSLRSAVVNPRLNADGLWDEALKQKLSATEITAFLSKGVLRKIAESVGIETATAQISNLEGWNLRYLPRLIEGASRFSESETKDGAFFLLYQVVLKATFRNEFSAIIDPQSPEPDATAYTEDELRMIGGIRDSNRLTKERFAKRGLDLESFHKGTERRLQGDIKSEDAIREAYSEVVNNVTKMFIEIQSFGLNEPDLAQHEIKARAALKKVETGDETQELPPLAALIQWYTDQRLQTSEPIISSKTKWERLGDRNQRSNDLLQLLVNEEGKWRFDWLPKPLKKAFKYSEQGKPLAVKDWERVGSSIAEVLSQTDSQTIDVPQEVLAYFEELSQILNEKAPQTSQNKVKPDVSPAITEALAAVTEIEAVLTKHKNSGQYSVQVTNALALTLDHISNRKSELRELDQICSNARDQVYDVTIKRWDRDPQTDIFVGDELACCVAIENFNGFAMLQYLTGWDVEVTKVIDNVTGNVVGGSFDYISEERNGELGYDLDNVELNPTHQLIKKRVRDTLTEMAAEVANAMNRGSNKGIKSIYLGDAYNDIPTADLEQRVKTIRKIAGHNSGFGQYLDTTIAHTEPGHFRRHPAAFHTVRLNHLADLPGVEAPQVEKEGFSAQNISILPQAEAERTQFWAQNKDQILQLESETFGLIGDSEMDLEELFTEPDTVIVTLTDNSGKIIGYSAAQQYTDSDLYVRSTAVDYEYQGLRAGKLLNEAVETEARRLGYSQLSRDAMVDTGYAVSLIRRAFKAGKLIEPEVELDQNGQPDIEATIEHLEGHSFKAGRYQVSVTTKL
jgi:ribosomal protein S18 acetylase RimI-like enzyme